MGEAIQWPCGWEVRQGTDRQTICRQCVTGNRCICCVVPDERPAWIEGWYTVRHVPAALAEAITHDGKAEE